MLYFPPTKHVIAWGQKQRENKCTKCCICVDYINLNKSEFALLKPGDSWKFISLGADLDLKWKKTKQQNNKRSLWSICMLSALYFLRKLQKWLKGGGLGFFLFISPLEIHSTEKVFRLPPVQSGVLEVSNKHAREELHHLPWMVLYYICINSCSEFYFLGAGSYILVSKWETSLDFIATTMKITGQLFFFSMCAGGRLL